MNYTISQFIVQIIRYYYYNNSMYKNMLTNEYTKRSLQKGSQKGPEIHIHKTHVFTKRFSSDSLSLCDIFLHTHFLYILTLVFHTRTFTRFFTHFLHTHFYSFSTVRTSSFILHFLFNSYTQILIHWTFYTILRKYTSTRHLDTIHTNTHKCVTQE